MWTRLQEGGRGEEVFLQMEEPWWQMEAPLLFPYSNLGRETLLGPWLEDNADACASVAQFPDQLCDLGKLLLPLRISGRLVCKNED